MSKLLLSEEVIEDLGEFIQNPVGILLFVGENGRGKSYVAKYIYSKVAKYALPARDWDQAWFINQTEFQALWIKENNDFGHTGILLNQAQQCDFLVLDDLGTRTPSIPFMDFLYALADYRYENRDKKGTIITTNLSSDAMREKFGDAFFSRMASGRNYIFQGPDRRFANLGF